MVTIFEDNPGMSVSRLLLMSLFGETLVFSEGNSKLYSKVCEYQYEDFILIFMDVVPNNQSVMWEYNRLKKKLWKIFGERCGKSVFLVPLFCIEFVVLQYLNEILQNEQLTEFIKEYKLPAEVKGYTQLKGANGITLRRDNNLKTFEFQCKAVLDYLTNDTLPSVFGKFIAAENRYILQGQEPEFGEQGCFYTRSCDACTKRCDLCAGSIEVKANMLYTRLPVFFSCENLRRCVGRQLRNASWGELHTFILQQYDKLYESFSLWWTTVAGQSIDNLTWKTVDLLF